MQITVITNALLKLILFTGCSKKALISKNMSLDKTALTQAPIVVKNVNIIPMTSTNKVLQKANVVIQNNKILSINDTIPKNSIFIDAIQLR